MSGKPFTQGYAKVLGKSPNVYKENARKFGIRWHGSVGRTTETSYPTGILPAGAENKVAWLSR